MDFLKYLAEQILSENVILKKDSDFLYIKYTDNTYVEDVFDPVTAFFSPEDIAGLQLIHKYVKDNLDINLWDIGNIKLLKNWYLITHEKYLSTDLVYDKHGRIGFDNVSEPFREILQIPVADVLRKIIQKKLNITKNSKPQIYLTCDFDTLNIWDRLGFVGFLKQNIKLSFEFKIKQIIYNTFSFFFSRRSVKFNGYLNDSMFVYRKDSNISNIAFFLCKPSNSVYDPKIDYSNRTIKSFFNKLKSNNVILGLHTNYDTADDPQNIQQQVDAFNRLFDIQPLFNRHHYLRCHFPEYLELLGRAGIKYDFSLYFPENTACRAGTCSKYKVWNVNTQSPYPAEVVPITLMDGTFTDYLKCTEQEAFGLAVKKLDLAIKYSNSIVLLWHNHCVFKYSNILNNYHPSFYKKIKKYLLTKTL